MFKLAFDSCFTWGYVSSHGHTTWSAKCRGTSTGCTSWAPEDGRNTQAWSSKRVESWLLIIGGLERKAWCGGGIPGQGHLLFAISPGEGHLLSPASHLRMRLTWHLELRMIWDWQMSATIFSDAPNRAQAPMRKMSSLVSRTVLTGVCDGKTLGKPTFSAMTQRSCGHRYAKP